MQDLIGSDKHNYANTLKDFIKRAKLSEFGIIFLACLLKDAKWNEMDPIAKNLEEELLVAVLVATVRNKRQVLAKL